MEKLAKRKCVRKKNVRIESKNSNIENAGPQEPLEKESQSSPSPFKNRTTRSQRFQMNMRRTTMVSKGGIKRGVRSKKL